MINKTILVGRVTKDPEIRQAGSTNCCNFTLAVKRKFTKEGQPDADFINCVAWGQSANFLGNYIKKGYLLAVEGRLQTRSYESQNGKVNVTEVMCDSVENLTPKPSTQNVKTYHQENFLDAPRIEYPSHKEVEISPDDVPFY